MDSGEGIRQDNGRLERQDRRRLCELPRLPHLVSRHRRSPRRQDSPGDRQGAKTPIVILHGGPGCTHDYVDSFKGLAAAGRAVVHYDQLGNGRSTHLREKGAEFWTPALFLDELDNLLAHLGIASAYHLLGQSWGGMLAAEHAVRRPKGLKALVIADSPASMELWLQAANELRAALPPEVQAVLLAHETAGTTSSPEYAKAVRVLL